MKTIFDKKWYLIDGDRYTSEEKQNLRNHGLFVYEMRSWDDGNGCTIEPRVLVNHEATFITNIDLKLSNNSRDLSGVIMDAYCYIEKNDFSPIDGIEFLTKWIEDVRVGVEGCPTLAELSERRTYNGQRRQEGVGGTQ